MNEENESGMTDDPYFQIWSSKYSHESDKKLDEWLDELEKEERENEHK